jgi:N-acetylmuramoyl-L-alanine amidase
MAALCELCVGVLACHPIPARNIGAHGNIAPGRKWDPGELFDWAGLARNGVGLWPADGAAPADDVVAALAAIGYRVDLPLPVLLTAFQRRWRQEAVIGEVGTRSRLAAVAAACGAAPA